MLATWVALLVVGSWNGERTLDDFSYAESAAAQKAWQPSEGTPPVDVLKEGSRQILQLRGDFSQRPAKRSVIDRKVELDLTAPGSLVLGVLAEPPEAVGHVTLYFRSGSGWYSAGATPAKKEGWQTLRFSKASFRTEGQPAGWDRIDGIRIALWREGDSDVAIRLRQLTAVSREVAIVVPDARDEGTEAKTATEAAQRVAGMLADLGLGCDMVGTDNLPSGGLGNRPLAIVAYCPRLDAQAAEALSEYVRGEGKLLLCYHLPAPLASALGFKSVKWVKEERHGQLAEIRFDTPDVVGLPEAMRQASWNITVAEPAGDDARVMGLWYDDQGQSTGYAAMLLGPKGAFFSHILLADDYPRKRQFLAAVLGHLYPPLWHRMAETALAGVGHAGHLSDRAQLEEYVRSQGNAAALQKLQAACQARDEAQGQFNRGEFPQAIASGRQAQEYYAEAYLRAAPSRAREGRAWWNHSGTGAYPGDWERTAKLLAENGFNMILPNMLWGGVAHYGSDLLPRSATYDQYGDQIEQCLAAAKRHGLEVHVWKVDWNLGHACPKTFIEQIRQQGRLMTTVTGAEHPWLCPSHPENQKLELDSLLEVATKYAVDGLHFDYIRYPGGNACYCDGCRRRFEQESGRKVTDWPKECYAGSRRDEYRQWRCDQITKLVAAVHREARRLRPEIKISAAVFSSYPDCKASVAQDWVHWVKAGYLDFLCPMEYTGKDETFCRLVANQLRLVEGKIPLYPGIGATASRVTLSPDRVVGQIHLARQLGAAGFTIFNLSPVTADAIVPGVGLGAAATKALPPHRSSSSP